MLYLLPQSRVSPGPTIARLTRGYDLAAGTAGRYNQLSVGTAASPANYSVGFGYDSAGRMSTVWGFTYAYAANSNLIQSTATVGWHYRHPDL